MPLVVRELSIKVEVGRPSQSAGDGSQAPSGERRGKDKDAATVKRAVEEVMRIEALRRER